MPGRTCTGVGGRHVALWASFMQVLSAISWHGGGVGGGREGGGKGGVWKGGGAGEKHIKLDLAPFQSSWFSIYNVCISILLRFL